MTDIAAQLAEKLRIGKKQQGLSDLQIAERIERLTGSRPSPMWVSRRLHGTTGRVPMVPVGDSCPNCGHPLRRAEIDPRLVAMADVLGVDLAQFTEESS